LMLASAASVADARQDEEEIARGIVIGQAYVSGKIVVAGFVGADERTWPPSITLARLFAPGAQHPNADFERGLHQESAVAFSGGAEIDQAQNVFAVIDGGELMDRPLALYESRVTIAESTGVIGWNGIMGVRDLSYRDRGQARPVSSRDRAEIAAERRKLPKDIACTTEPRWIDSARILLTATITNSKSTIRLSSYQTPGCLGHLSTIYVLDILTPGREPRRFEFRHYQGVL
jgi:hypothetical protein